MYLRTFAAAAALTVAVLPASAAITRWTPLHSENFGASGNVPGGAPVGWDLVAGASSSATIITASTSPANTAGSGKGVRLLDTGDSAVRLSRDHGATLGVMRIDFSVRRLNGATDSAALQVAMGPVESDLTNVNGVPDRAFDVNLRNNGSVGVNSSGFVTGVLSATASNRLQIVANGSSVTTTYAALDGSGDRTLGAKSVDVYVENVLITPSPRAFHSVTASGDTLGTYGFFTFNSSDTLDWAVDDVVIYTPSAAEFAWTETLPGFSDWLQTAPGAPDHGVSLPSSLGAAGPPSSGWSNLYVDAASTATNPTGSSTAPYPSLTAAWNSIVNRLNSGTPTRVLIRPGIYRESINASSQTSTSFRTTPLWIDGNAGDTPANDGVATFRGSVVIPTSAWTNLGGGLFRALRPSDLRPQQDSFGYAGMRAHYRDLVFMNGMPLRQEQIEDIDISMSMSAGQDATYAYPGTSEHQPADLTPGTFGVTTRPGVTQYVYVRLPHGLTPSKVTLEVTEDAQWLVLPPKDNLTLKDLVVERYGNRIDDSGNAAPLQFAKAANTNVLIERCTFRWNSGHGLKPWGEQWTIKDSHFDYNGFVGLSVAELVNSSFENVAFNFNNWRTPGANPVGSAFVGGLKAHKTVQHRLWRGVAIGNILPGVWYDISCEHVFNEDLILTKNSLGLFWEYSKGPFYGRRVLSALNRGKSWPAFKISLVADSLLDRSIGYSAGQFDANGNPDTDMTWVAIKERDDYSDAWPLWGNEIRNTIFLGGPGVRSFVLYANTLPLAARHDDATYTGSGNTFHHHTLAGGSTYFGVGYGTLKNLAGWNNTALISEANALEQSPGFIDPNGGDFRFGGTSLPQARRDNMPAYRIPPEWLEEADRFEAWARNVAQ